MSFPESLQNTFLPQEIQFIVENEPIKILPRITTRQRKQYRQGSNYDPDSKNSHPIKPWRLITTNDYNVNNMIAMKSTELPLWMAVLLKEQKKCNIIAPNWITVSNLDKYIDFELKNPMKFSSLPWNWLVIACILFTKAPDDLTDPIHLLKSRCQDLREIRLAKVQNGLAILNESHLQLDNLSLMEINEIRPYATKISDMFKNLHKNTAAGLGEDYDMHMDTSEPGASFNMTQNP
ncbi:related to DNA replication complex GINS protein PSF2 [Saccharomycodes ludwigii]|uniref:DNA replication complex GINS protein PSF2 n=1 Tax=Saccharomycodes ludwigii TaxID=36035 RepID=A0A376B1D7_9ASCO|nr:related to DNA replication complex GINS protein PSF2 [Saccharomycodes ludwigii]